MEQELEKLLGHRWFNIEDSCNPVKTSFQQQRTMKSSRETREPDRGEKEIIKVISESYTLSIPSTAYRSLQKDIVDIQKAIQKLRKKVESKNIYIQNLRHPNYILKYPLSVTFEYENDLCVANCYDIGMHGQGDTEEEAINDLCEIVIEYYESLKDDENKLGPSPTKHWIYLKRIIEKKENGN